MLVTDFVTKEEFADARKLLLKKEPFCLGRTVKCNEGTVCVEIHSDVIDQDLADDIWEGERYLVFFNNRVAVRGDLKGDGYARSTYEMFDSWETFTKFFDKFAERLPSYQQYKFEPEQLSLFD